MSMVDTKARGSLKFLLPLCFGCVQCGRFHTLDRFDGEKKSCRERLQWHNERRRLAQARTALRAGGNACSQAPMLEDSAQVGPACLCSLRSVQQLALCAWFMMV